MFTRGLDISFFKPPRKMSVPPLLEPCLTYAMSDLAELAGFLRSPVLPRPLRDVCAMSGKPGIKPWRDQSEVGMPVCNTSARLDIDEATS